MCVDVCVGVCVCRCRCRCVGVGSGSGSGCFQVCVYIYLFVCLDVRSMIFHDKGIYILIIIRNRGEIIHYQCRMRRDVMVAGCV